MGQVDLLKKFINRQTVFAVATGGMMLLSAFLPMIASAAPISGHSITPSTASVNAAAGSVQYEVTFTPAANAGAFVVDFCTNTPLLGQGCDAPTGMNVGPATTSDATIVSGGATDANTIVATKTMTAAEQTVTFANITNPTSAGVVYARIITYVDGNAADDYLSDDPTAVGTIEPIDNGSVSMYFNEDVTVQGTVLETMTFCVSGTVITPDCSAGDSGASITDPTITLGEETAPSSGIFALVPGTVSEGTLYTQMNTNSANGAVVRLKSSATCGGLMRLGTSDCDIAAALGTDVVADNTAKFGVKIGTATAAAGATNPIGTLIPYDADGEGAGTAFYDTDHFRFNFDDTDETGVTSVLGDPLLGTDSAPATNQNMPLTFAATVGTDTPAGTYATDLSLIAVGKF